jgi:hypothetical protein
MAQERCESLAESALLEISTGRVLRLIASSWPADTEIQGSISAEDHLSDVLPLWQTRSTPHWPACVGDHERVCAPRERRPVVLRTGLTPLEIAGMPFPAFWARVQAMRNGRRVWQSRSARSTNARHPRWRRRTAWGPRAGLRRIVDRVDGLAQQHAAVSAEIHELLADIDEAQYLATLPGIGWV